MKYYHSTDSMTIGVFSSARQYHFFVARRLSENLKAENQESQNVEVLFRWLVLRITTSSHSSPVIQNNTDDNEQLVASRVPHGLLSIYLRRGSIMCRIS